MKTLTYFALLLDLSLIVLSILNKDLSGVIMGLVFLILIIYNLK